MVWRRSGLAPAPLRSGARARGRPRWTESGQGAWARRIDRMPRYGIEKSFSASYLGNWEVPREPCAPAGDGALVSTASSGKLARCADRPPAKTRPCRNWPQKERIRVKCAAQGGPGRGEGTQGRGLRGGEEELRRSCGLKLEPLSPAPCSSGAWSASRRRRLLKPIVDDRGRFLLEHKKKPNSSVSSSFEE